MSRKTKNNVVLDNIGGHAEDDAYTQAAQSVREDGTSRNLQHMPMVMVDRVLIRLLRSEVKDLSENEEKLTRIFAGFFGTSVAADEVKQWVEYVTYNPPHVTSAYPHTGSQFPGFFIVLEGDDESTTFVNNYAGAKLGDAPGDDADYFGSFFDQTFGIYIYDHNPDAVAMLYQLAKLIVLGGSDALTANGIMNLHLSGGELSPQDAYIPQDMFLRRLLVTVTTPQTVERLRRQRRADQVRIVGVHASDVVVDGARGGVHHSPHECDDE